MEPIKIELGQKIEVNGNTLFFGSKHSHNLTLNLERSVVKTIPVESVKMYPGDFPRKASMLQRSIELVSVSVSTLHKTKKNKSEKKLLFKKLNKRLEELDQKVDSLNGSLEKVMITNHKVLDKNKYCITVQNYRIDILNEKNRVGCSVILEFKTLKKLQCYINTHIGYGRIEDPTLSQEIEDIEIINS